MLRIESEFGPKRFIYPNSCKIPGTGQKRGWKERKSWKIEGGQQNPILYIQCSQCGANSQQLRWPAPGLHKAILSCQSCTGEGLPGPNTPLNCGPLIATVFCTRQTPLDSSNPKVTQMALAKPRGTWTKWEAINVGKKVPRKREFGREEGR